MGGLLCCLLPFFLWRLGCLSSLACVTVIILITETSMSTWWEDEARVSVDVSGITRDIIV